MSPATPIRIHTVTELTHRIRAALEDEVGTVCVEGEITNLKCYPSGHRYFSLKDAGAQLSAVLFAGMRATGNLKDGQKIRAYGNITVYPERGQYQMIVRTVEPAGAGDLMLQFEALKARLQAEGLFDNERKRPLPVLPQRVGIVTSPAGAVIHDIITILGRRFPNLNIRLAPVSVQGPSAADEIAAAIRRFNRMRETGKWYADVLIVGRGGGSLEDLWAFNVETVVRAVAGSGIPVVSAVGHETDYTLCDFAADVRAPTPSAAAEIIIPPKAELEATLHRHAETLRRALTRHAEQLAQTTDTFDLRLRHALQQQVQDARARVEHTAATLTLMRERNVRHVELRLRLNRQRLTQACALRLERHRSAAAMLARQLELLNPLTVLERGYTLTRTEDGKLVRSVSDVDAGSPILLTHVNDGILRSRIECPVPM
ncbi:MAG: exodeoxyribonuclease VII large subunit [Kiritimatiellaeota bacterium]|nr:exodeoxyribonuclease VII large subunit [Kiritimatiellota bacterium]